MKVPYPGCRRCNGSGDWYGSQDCACLTEIENAGHLADNDKVIALEAEHARLTAALASAEAEIQRLQEHHDKVCDDREKIWHERDEARRERDQVKAALKTYLDVPIMDADLEALKAYTLQLELDIARSWSKRWKRAAKQINKLRKGWISSTFKAEAENLQLLAENGRLRQENAHLDCSKEKIGVECNRLRRENEVMRSALKHYANHYGGGEAEIARKALAAVGTKGGEG